MNIIRSLLCTTLLMGQLVSAVPTAITEVPQEPRRVAAQQVASDNFSSMLTFVGIQSLFLAVKTAIHECGHAAVAYACDPKALHDIHLYSYRPDSPTLFSLGKLHVHTEHFGGFTRLGPLPEPYATLCDMAGGVAGSAFCYVILAAIATYCCYQDRQTIAAALADGIKHSLSPFACIVQTEHLSPKTKEFLLDAAMIALIALVNEVFYAFTPNHYMAACSPLGLAGDAGMVGDGEKLWDHVCDQDSKTRTALRIMSIMGQLLCSVLVYKQYYEAMRQL